MNWRRFDLPFLPGVCYGASGIQQTGGGVAREFKFMKAAAGGNAAGY
jgi:hypothetical protein